MGCFNTVNFACPSCNEPIKVQSKGGCCSLRDISPNKVPLGDADYILNDEVYCKICGARWIVSTVQDTKTVALCLERPVTPDEDDEGY